ncbi:hypothetical protein [Bacteroides mediterraneensis]|uniref:hypothetical protein n=1 Tax=Bacteroides mediterraneensis TaxID=1841856 RepID=UPI0019577D3F|nr:hypothetical protein [Bacteroides mediterraneensis]MBM6781431.1 hypothetical protein [Bacteroides mediterraneensis]
MGGLIGNGNNTKNGLITDRKCASSGESLQVQNLTYKIAQIKGTYNYILAEIDLFASQGFQSYKISFGKEGVEDIRCSAKKTVYSDSSTNLEVYTDTDSLYVRVVGVKFITIRTYTSTGFSSPIVYAKYEGDIGALKKIDMQ